MHTHTNPVELKLRFPQSAVMNDLSRQAGGMMFKWRNPSSTRSWAFLAVNPLCSPDPYPGVVIIASGSQAAAAATTVKNLSRELPKLLAQHPANAVAFWWMVTDAKKREQLLANLTASPVYADHSWAFPSNYQKVGAEYGNYIARA